VLAASLRPEHILDTATELLQIPNLQLEIA
jgi:hypothetical protein